VSVGLPTLFPLPRPDLPAASRGGILPYQVLKQFVADGLIRATEPIDEVQFQPASIDLRLGPVAYRVEASFLPSPDSTVMARVADLMVEEIDLSGPATLERGSVYIIPLLEALSLPQNTLGKANPKSTTGRLDVFTRLITDGGKNFERARRGYSGKLYVEVAPRTFNVIVHKGTRLNQLRLVRGHPSPSDTQLKELKRAESIVYSPLEEPEEPSIENGLWVTVDLKGTDPTLPVGFRAKATDCPIDLDRVAHYPAEEFWEPICPPERGQLILHPHEFYILASRERVRIPPTYAAEMIGYDPSVGEFRVHYAGFFDPGFGYDEASRLRGTPAVLEVRSHEVAFLMRHRQRVGRFLFERMLTEPERMYGSTALGSSYQHQRVALSKQFKQPG
jgi:dCTP deaminase